jgi:general transcription factor 3C polypeptide 5 (transcription factor C subunit 1)
MNEASAPVFALPPELASFVAIEYPGPVNSSAASVERALDVLGGLDKVSAAINAKDANASLVELNYSNRPLHDRNFTHPILGEAVETGNLMLKVVRRRRRHPAPGEEAGVYSVQVAGLVKQTIRFRGSCVC